MSPSGEPLSLLDVYHSSKRLRARIGSGSRERKDLLLDRCCAGRQRRSPSSSSRPSSAKCATASATGLCSDGIACAAAVTGRSGAAGQTIRAPAIWDWWLACEQEARRGLSTCHRGLVTRSKPMLAQTAADVAAAFMTWWAVGIGVISSTAHAADSQGWRADSALLTPTPDLTDSLPDVGCSGA